MTLTQATLSLPAWPTKGLRAGSKGHVNANLQGVWRSLYQESGLGKKPKPWADVIPVAEVFGHQEAIAAQAALHAKLDEEERDRSARWAQFVESARSHGQAADVADAISAPVRAEMGNEWQLAAATEDWTIVMTWEGTQRYVEFEIGADGLGGWFCKDRRTQDYDGGDFNSASEAVNAVLQWLKSHPA